MKKYLKIQELEIEKLKFENEKLEKIFAQIKNEKSDLENEVLHYKKLEDESINLQKNIRSSFLFCKKTNKSQEQIKKKNLKKLKKRTNDLKRKLNFKNRPFQTSKLPEKTLKMTKTEINI